MKKFHPKALQFDQQINVLFQLPRRLFPHLYVFMYLFVTSDFLYISRLHFFGFILHSGRLHFCFASFSNAYRPTINFAS